MQKLLQKITENKLIIICIIIDFIISLTLYFYWPLSSVIAIFFGLLGSILSIYSLCYNDRKNKENLKLESDYPIKKSLLTEILAYIQESKKYEDMIQIFYLAEVFEPLLASGKTSYLPLEIQRDIEFIIYVADKGIPVDDVVGNLLYNVVKELKEKYGVETIRN